MQRQLETDFGCWVKETLAFLDCPHWRSIGGVVVGEEGVTKAFTSDAAGIIRGLCITVAQKAREVEEVGVSWEYLE